MKNDPSKLEKLENLIEHFLPIQKWGFRKSSAFFSGNAPDVSEDVRTPRFPTIIYNSKYCRIKFLVGNEGYLDHLKVYYGRLHASDDERTMMWNGEECYCWHWDIPTLLLKFLDGKSPQEAANLRVTHPKRLQAFIDLELDKTVEQPEFVARYHAAIWENYNKDLLEIFDLHHPELWENYAAFKKDYYNIVVMPPNITPLWYKIC